MWVSPMQSVEGLSRTKRLAATFSNKKFLLSDYLELLYISFSCSQTQTETLALSVCHACQHSDWNYAMSSPGSPACR